MPPPDTSRLHAEDPTRCSDDTARGHFLIPNPEFILSLRQSILNDSLNKVTLSCLRSRISISSCGAQDVIGKIVQVQHGAVSAEHNNAEQRRQREARVLAAHLHNQDALFSSHTLFGHQDQEDEHEVLLREGQTPTNARQHVKTCTESKCFGCVDGWNKDARLRTNMQEHSNNSVNCYRKQQHEKVLVQISRGGHDSTKSTDHPKYVFAFQMKPKSAESPTTPARRTQQAEIPRTDVIAQVSVAFPLLIVATNLAMDKLDLVGRMVELTFVLSQA